MNKSYYFQHDYNSANDHKILFLRQQFGIEGYGIYWYVIEQLAQSNGRLPLKIVPVLAMQIQTTHDKVMAVIKNYDLFQIENEEFFSVRLLKQIEFRSELSIAGKDGANKRWENYRLNQAKNSPPISPPNSTPYAKERKGKEIKEINIPFGESFKVVWNDWLTYRKETKQKTPITTIEKQLKFLSTKTESEAIKIINQSIMNSWKGLFDLKGNQQNQSATVYKKGRAFGEGQ